MRDRVAVSLIVPVYGLRTEAFQLCLASHREQTFDDYERIVIDNGCPDLSLEGVDGDRLRCFRFDENTGAANGRNKGASLARGDLLLFVDADIRLPPTAIEDLLDEYRLRPCDALMAVHQGEAYYKNFPSVFKHAYLSYFLGNLDGPVCFLDTSCLLMRREMWERHGGFHRLSTLEDYDLGKRMTAAGATNLTTQRVKMEHLRYYSHSELLATDFARAVMKMRLMCAYRGTQDGTSGEVMPEYRNSVMICMLGALLPLLGVPLGSRVPLWSFALPPLLVFGGVHLVNRRFLAHFLRLSDGRFRFRFLVFLVLDMLVVGVGASYGLLLHLLGRKTT